MNLQTAIFNQVLQPKYIKVYKHIEEYDRCSKMSIRLAHGKDIVDILVDIISIKERYGIHYSDDLKLLEKYKI